MTLYNNVFRNTKKIYSIMETPIKVENLKKTFFLPHERKLSIKQYFTAPFSRGTYEKFKALDDVSFDVQKGKWLGIIGKNGSGKSTLLKVLTEVYEPDSGAVKADGSIVSFLELGIGFIPDLTVRENIFLNGTILGMTRKEILKKFDAIVAFSELGNFLDQKMKNLSTGMQMRAGFSVAAQVEADIYLLDEILAVGDFEFQKKCLNAFEKLKEKNKTIVFASHDMQSVEKYCDRVIWIDKGKIKADGLPKETIRQYLMER